MSQSPDVDKVRQDISRLSIVKARNLWKMSKQERHSCVDVVQFNPILAGKNVNDAKDQMPFIVMINNKNYILEIDCRSLMETTAQGRLRLTVSMQWDIHPQDVQTMRRKMSDLLFNADTEMKDEALVTEEMNAFLPTMTMTVLGQSSLVRNIRRIQSMKSETVFDVKTSPVVKMGLVMNNSCLMHSARRGKQLCFQVRVDAPSDPRLGQVQVTLPCLKLLSREGFRKMIQSRKFG